MKRKKFGYGGRNRVVRNYLETPSETLAENDIMLAKAKSKAANNGWVKATQILGTAAIQYGMNKMGAGGASGSITGAFNDPSDGGIVGGESSQGFDNQQSTFNAGFGDGGFGDAMGNDDSMYAAFGGEVKSQEVEVEDGETAELPDGGLLEFKGKDHKDGGIDVNLPDGTDIFSKRISIKGITMAEREKARKKEEQRLAKLLDKTPYDKTLENTFLRTQETNKMEQEKDKRLQKAVKMVKDLASMSNQVKKKAAWGLDGGDDPENPLYANMTDEDFLAQAQVFLQMNQDDGAGTTAGKGVEGGTDKPGTGFGRMARNLFGGTDPDGNEVEGGLNLNMGDLAGMAGTMYSAFAPMANTKKQRSEDTPNINAFRDFGNDALDRIDSAKGYADEQKSKALLDVDKGRNRIIQGNRASARGVNTLRALDLAADSQATDQKSDIYDQFSKNMMNMLSTQAGFENQQDSAVMAGEQARDLADREDRDNYYSQLAQDIASKGQGIQQGAKMLNQQKLNKAKTEAVNNTSTDFSYVNGKIVDKNGKVKMSPAEIEKAARVGGFLNADGTVNTEKYLASIGITTE